MKPQSSLEEQLLSEQEQRAQVNDEIGEFALVPSRSSLAIQAEVVPLSSKTQQFLQSIELTPQDLKAAGIDLTMLDQVINRGCSGRALRWLALDSAIAKALMYPFLDERGILSPTLKRQSCKRWCKTRSWPHATSLPFVSEDNLKRAFGVTAFTEGIDSVIARLWSGLLASFIATDYMIITLIQMNAMILPSLKSS